MRFKELLSEVKGIRGRLRVQADTAKNLERSSSRVSSPPQVLKAAPARLNAIGLAGSGTAAGTTAE
jgi:conjugal transfer/entry exclusion protein